MADSILLYRFLGLDSALRTIEGRKFRVGRLKEFNDPFEWRVGLTGYIPEGEVVAQACMDQFIDAMNADFGVICFSDTHEDPVLWSHYADNHRGVAFEVDYLLTSGTLAKVNYSDERPVMDTNWLNDLDSFPEKMKPLVMKMLHQKAPGWSYEREYRVNTALNECESGGGHYFQQIPGDFLKRVILGFRCPLDVAYIRKALDEVGLTDTQVARASMDQYSYRIKC